MPYGQRKASPHQGAGLTPSKKQSRSFSGRGTFHGVHVCFRISIHQNPERAPGGTYAPESVRPEQPQPAAFRLNPALRGRDMWYWAGDLTSSTRSWSYESFAFVCGGGRVHAGSHPASFAGGVRPFALPVQPPISRASARQRLMAAIRHFNSQASPRPRSPNCLTRHHLSIR